jgi:hypothetical protein
MSESVADNQSTSAAVTEGSLGGGVLTPQKPFTTDVLQSCTARMTRKAWDLYLRYCQPIEQIRTLPVRACLTARTDVGVKVLADGLQAVGVTSMTENGCDLHFTATFEAIQAVIKLPETLLLDAVRI